MGDRTPADGADVCVIGAGIAGGLVSYSLARRGYDVVVLEAGPWFDEIDVRERMERAIRPEHPRIDAWPESLDTDPDSFTASTPDGITCRLNVQRLKGVGGTTQHWSAHVSRLRPKDFEMDSRYGLATDWPVGYEDLRPYYAAAESEIGVAGGGDNPFVPREEDPPMPPHPRSYTDSLFADACDELDIRTHSLPRAINTEEYDGRTHCVGYSTCLPVCPSGAKYTGEVHVRKAQSAGVRVIDRAAVQRLEHDADGTNVEAAVYATPDGETHRQTASQFVVAAGGIETPRLLLLSASDRYPDGLANSSGAVGKYLFSTSAVRVSGVLDEPANEAVIPFSTMATDEFYDHDEPRPGSLRLTFSNVDPRSPVDVALRGGASGTRDQLTEPLTGGAWGDELLEHMEHAEENRQVGMHAEIEMLPREDNTVTLSDDAVDDHGNPAPHVTFDVGDHTVETGEYAIEVMTEILTEAGAEITSVGDPATQRLANHHKGTTRMGSDPDESVVDSRLQTHDLDNCWLVSSSVFPTGGAVPPTLTIATLALKAADHLAAEL